MDIKADNETIYSRFSHWVACQQDAPAVAEDGRAVSYRQLDRMANAIMSKFYGKEYQAVGIVMSHSIEMMAAILAVLKSGAAYVPTEPSLPKERIDYMMSTAGVEFVINDEYCRDLPDVGPHPDRSNPRRSGLHTLHFRHIGATKRSGGGKPQCSKLCGSF